MEAIIAAVSSTTMIDSIIRRRLRIPGIAPASFGQQLAEQTAGRKTLRVGSFIADDALAAELYAGSGAVVFPIAHPVAIAASRNSALVTGPSAKHVTTSIISTVADITLVFKTVTLFR